MLLEKRCMQTELKFYVQIWSMFVHKFFYFWAVVFSWKKVWERIFRIVERNSCGPPKSLKFFSHDDDFLAHQVSKSANDLFLLVKCIYQYIRYYPRKIGVGTLFSCVHACIIAYRYKRVWQRRCGNAVSVRSHWKSTAFGILIGKHLLFWSVNTRLIAN